MLIFLKSIGFHVFFFLNQVQQVGFTVQSAKWTLQKEEGSIQTTMVKFMFIPKTVEKYFTHLFHETSGMDRISQSKIYNYLCI